MKIKNKLFISFVLLLIVLIFNSKVQAASASISASSTNVTPGTKVTITTKISGASWQVSLSGAVSATYSDSTSDAEDTVKYEKTTFTPKKEGTYKISLSGNVTGSADSSSTSVSGSVIITAKEKTSNNSNTNNTADSSSKPSTDATLSNLGIKPNDFSGFRKATTSYSVSVPKSVDKISIYATASNSKATVTGTGAKTLQIGKNTFNIKVTAEDKKTTKTYTLNITRKSEEEEIKSDATLTNLGIRPKEYDFTGFKPSVTTYSVSVPNDVEKITVYATAKNSKDTITGSGNKSLKIGQNKCEIKVTSEDKKKTKTYVINVTRKEKEEETEEETNEEEKDEKENENNEINSLTEGIKNIEIKDYALTPSFSQDVYSYKVDVNEAIEKLEIDTEATSDDIEVEIAGNEELKQGENIITILVHNKKDDTTSTYQITANVGNQEANSTTENQEQKDGKSGIKLKEWIIKGVIFVIVVLILLFLVKRHKTNQEYDYDDEEDDEDDKDEEDSEEYRYEYEDNAENNIYNSNKYSQNIGYKSTASEEIRNIGIFDDTQKIEFEEIDRQKKHGKYKGKRFK